LGAEDVVCIGKEEGEKDEQLGHKETSFSVIRREE